MEGEALTFHLSQAVEKALVSQMDSAVQQCATNKQVATATISWQYPNIFSLHMDI